MPADEQASLPDDLSSLRESLLDWYAEHHREFPWRNTTDPYAILVSEIMSHQTQLARVEEAYDAFLDRWPTIDALAEASQRDVVGFWSAYRLGYNNRARYLHQAANQVVTDYGGSIPRTPDELEALPGVGPYTANAVASFAFNEGNAVVDTNVKRVLYRAFDTPDDDAQFETVANTLMPSGCARDWNNAMMELGAVICTKTPKCEEAPCPWRHWCDAYATSDFTAPDVPSQSTFAGSRRQFRGRIIRTLQSQTGSQSALRVDELGHRIRVDYVPDGEYGREWLTDILDDLAADGLVTLIEDGDALKVALRE